MTDNAPFQKDFLDNVAYTVNIIRRFEFIFDQGFTSVGGRRTTEKLLSLYPPACFSKDSSSPPRVLDVGCGLGGHAWLMADKFGAEVTAVDLSGNMITMAKDRLANHSQEVRKRVRLMQEDVLKCDFPKNSFDLIYSRNATLHVEDKENLYSRYKKWLKPGGEINITEFMNIPANASACKEWTDLQESRKYYLLSPSEYANMVKGVGFGNVKVEDITWELLNSLKREVGEMETKKVAFIEDFSPDDFQDLMANWKTKIDAAEANAMIWGLVLATK